jgi:hypothetical protein
MLRMPDNPHWTRVYQGGWLTSAMHVVTWLLLVIGLPLALLGTAGRVAGGDVHLESLLGFWVAASWVGFLSWRIARLGTWSSAYGLRVDRLLRWDRIPWRRVAGFVVESTPPLFGWKVRRTLIVTARGDRIVLPGTNALAARVLMADPPERARHRLERERRYYLGERLPRRRPDRTGDDRVIDLRTAPPTRSGPVPTARR